MARINESGITAALGAAELWRQRCLENDGGLFSSAPVWSPKNLTVLDARVVGNPIEGGQKFNEKLRRQLDGAPPHVIQLAAEMLWFMFLFPSSMGRETKRRDILEVYSWSGQQLDPTHALLDKPLESGIGNPGVAFLTLRWKEFGYFLHIAQQLKLLPRNKLATLLTEPWAFSAWLDQQQDSQRRQLRHILLYLLFPDTFERIAVTKHRRTIIQHFTDCLPEIDRIPIGSLEAVTNTELDHCIFKIRKALESQFPNTGLDFYRSPLNQQLDLIAKPPAIKHVTELDATEGDVSLDTNPETFDEVIERSMPNEMTRHAALSLFAAAIEIADEERSDAWYVRPTSGGFRLMTGRLRACSLWRGKIRLGIVGTVDDENRERLHADTDEDSEIKSIPGALSIRFPAEHANQALLLLRESLRQFVEAAMARVRSRVSLEDHSTEAVEYIAHAVGRTLPDPTNDVMATGIENDEDDGELSRKPQVRGRAPIFEHGQRSIASLMSDIERGQIALPDLQRPFVWEDTKVRDLLDSLFVGFPVGTLVLWHTQTETDTRAVGADRPGLRANTLVIDGQQRLTSLYAVMGGVEVIGKDGGRRRITIAFRPRDGRFEVADAAIRNDPEFLPNVTDLWSGLRAKPQIRRDLMNALRNKGRVVDAEYEDAVERNLDRAHSISDYRFPLVDIRKTAASGDSEVSEEDVAEIFVRINNQGTRLGQADFVLTLLSVFHGDLRDRIEERSREMSQGTVATIDTQQLLRAVCAVAFGRARMAAIYRYLRGVDPVTGEADTAGRLQRLQLLDSAAKECLEPLPWRDYLLRVKHAGFVNQSLIASRSAVVNAYAFYIRGRRASIPKSELDDAISRWIFGTLLTARYSGSSETVFEQDLSRVGRGATDESAGFVHVLDHALMETLTNDYWNQTLVSSLETQKARAPVALAFRAAQVVLGARALFSDQLLQNVLDPPAQSARAACEVHHLFPEAWLRSRGVGERRMINQVANLADVGWHENAVIGGKSPSAYVPAMRDRLGIDDDQWGRSCAEHALPPQWESMDYREFLDARRRRMADVIRVAFRQLGGEEDAPPLTPPWFLPGAEEVWKQIAQTERSLRSVVRKAYSKRFGDRAGEKVAAALSERERETLVRAQRAQPPGSDPLSVVDYLYLGQLHQLLFASDVWPDVRQYFGGASDAKQRLQSAIEQIVPVRNEIAHVREVGQQRLLRAAVGCADVIEMLRASAVLDSTSTT